MSVTKTMYVKENSFRKLDDPFNSLAKKYVFYVKICDVPGGIPMATNPVTRDLHPGSHRQFRNPWKVTMAISI